MIVPTTSLASTALKLAGPAFFIGLQGSSVKTALKIVEEKSVGNLSIIPFASLFVNALIWALYGLLKHDNTLFLPNGLGVLTGGFCFSAYKMNSKNKDTAYNFGVVLLTTIAGGLFMNKNADLLGSIGCVLAVLLMGAPLATLSTVFKEKSTASMPFETSLMSFGNALSWSLYGLLDAHDPMIYGPSMLGVCLAGFQLGLFAVYGLPKTPPSSTPFSIKGDPSDLL